VGVEGTLAVKLRYARVRSEKCMCGLWVGGDYGNSEFRKERREKKREIFE